MTVEIRPFTSADAEGHCAGEDELIVRWLTGGYGDVEGTIEYFEEQARKAEAGARKRSFGVWTDGRLCGFIDHDVDNDDGIDVDDVSLSYSVHPWARGRGVAVEAVRLVCDLLRAEGIGRRAAIRVEPGTRGRSGWRRGPASRTSVTSARPGTGSPTGRRPP